MLPKEQARVLVVDDDPIVTELVRTQLNSLGYIVVGTVFNGPDAVTLTKKMRPDVVLMDLRMSDPETGHESRLAGLRAAELIQEQCPTPVVLLTAYESPELVRQASAAGVVSYLVKPVRSNDLDRAIAIALARFNDLMELRRLNANLQARNAELDAFVDTVAHDLKAPLAPIIGYAEVLADKTDTMSIEELQRYLRVIATTAHKMSNIIDELLLLASVRKEDVQVEPLIMEAIVQEAVQRLSAMIESESATLKLPEKWPIALGYAPWVEEVWVNYLSNAIKYGGTPPKAEIGASYVQVEGERMVRYWVRDNGPGLTESQQRRLFTPFERLGQVRAKGHGLGLSIVHRIIDKLGGQVGVESEVRSESTFYFTLPAAPREALEAEE